MTYPVQPHQRTTRDAIVYASRGLKIFGMIHRDTEPAMHARPGVVMYHGFVAAKYQPPHRLFVQLAEALALLGIVSLRIDLPGRGDSEGESIDMTVEGDLAAAQQAIDVLAAQSDVDDNRIGLVGISWGGILAATLAGRDPRVAATVLWSSAPSERLDWRPTLQDVDGRRVTEFVGNLIGEQFYAGLHQLTPLADLTRTRGPVLLIYGTQDNEVAASDIERVQQQLAVVGIPAEVKPIVGSDHVFFAHPWQRQVIDTTAPWLHRVLHLHL